MNKLLFAPLALSLVGHAALSQAQENPAGEPASAEPASAPPPGPEAAPTAPPPPEAPQAARPAPTGQWVYTSQYGWLWMPYGQAYTSVYPESDVAYMYAYYPAYGWRWVSSPWVFGFGPAPYWGVHGRVGFAWYAHPWFHPAFAYHGAYHGSVYRGPVPHAGAYHGSVYRGPVHHTGAYHAPSQVSHAAGGFHGFHGGRQGHR